MASPVTRPFCLLCTVPRSGSHHLIGELAVAGVGVLAEYLSPYRNARSNQRSAGVDEETRRRALSDIHAADARRAKSRIHELSGVTAPPQCRGTKLFPDEISAILASYDDLETFFEVRPIRYLYLRRRDVIRQAVSAHVARWSGRWFRYAGDPEAGEVPYDFEAIRTFHRKFELGYAALDRVFAQGTEPLVVEYEELVDRPGAVVARVAEFLGVAADAAYRPGERVLFVRQAGRTSEALVARYREDLRAAR